MGADSLLRRMVKHTLFPFINAGGYKYVQAFSKAWDIYNRSWYEPEIDLIPYAVQPGETALDIGANFGFYCYHLSQAVGPEGRVYAFEPVPFTFETLCLVSKLLRIRSVEFIAKGCSNENGEMMFRVPVQSSGALSAGQAHISLRNNDRAGREKLMPWTEMEEVRAEVVRLDDALSSLDRLSLIKSDIEGAEWFAFQGAEKLIDQHLPSVICEINPWFLEGFGIALEDLLGFFFNKDYQLYFYSNDEGKQHLRPIGPEDIVSDDYVFIHPGRLDRFAPFLASA